MAEKQWEIGKLELRMDLVWSLAMSSLRVRLGRAFITGLTITTATAFMMYLLSMPAEDPSAELASGLAGWIGLRKAEGAEGLAEIQGFLLMLLMSLVVAAAGVLNTMLMSVTQRYREIGTIKCLGGLDQLVLYSVLLEAAIVGLGGAVIGVAIGLAISSILAAADYGSAMLSHMNIAGLPLKIIGVFLIGMGLTTLGAAVPAYIAAKMPPIEAMRGEK